ncbi:hypothetical protein A2U01_0090926, partial [Trifolium medium]|nr:hypothetical protein [Trifolium medium]
MEAACGGGGVQRWSGSGVAARWEKAVVSFLSAVAFLPFFIL